MTKTSSSHLVNGQGVEAVPFGDSEEDDLKENTEKMLK